MSGCLTSSSSKQRSFWIVPALLLFLVVFALPAVAGDNLTSLFNFQTKMAAQGSSDAMIKLGEMCEEGLGTEKNMERAREWYQRALDKKNPDAQAHLDKLKRKEERAKEQAAREQAAREQAAREQSEREQAAREQAARVQSASEQAAQQQAAQEQAEREKAAQEAAAKREAAIQAMTPEEKARAREEAIRRAEEADQRSLQKQIEKEKAESDALKRARITESKKK